MAVPKRRMSRANTHARRSQWKATPPDLIPVKVGGVVHQVPRRIAKAVQLGLIDVSKI
ncbi:50S ribosomal protein L32 [Nocardia huaxiensis]|uniref:Large ribosomal subunit protein bL32 n=1 Tax=Nocardia huaxiensis TaxID=2755382 RepID=A0A7D6VGX7_9NOCA|nr:50S ribosomal protein L32 [Nocardia huaxiensis]QLY32495.1 50S ribosomal protein L32 [Nocardia huaxiensis]UFS93797.1 50S ribosomal protein L32 [Nocardia huaxiensis]